MKKKRAVYWFLFFTAIWLSLVSLVLKAKAQDEPKSKEDNPFLDRYSELIYEDQDRRTIAGMALTAVFYSGDDSRAVIDGRIVRKGDIINNLEVIEIKSEKVYFEDYLGKKCILEMQSILEALRAAQPE